MHAINVIINQIPVFKEMKFSCGVSKLNETVYDLEFHWSGIHMHIMDSEYVSELLLIIMLDIISILSLLNCTEDK